MILCCRLRSRRLNQRNPQTQHLLLLMVVNLGVVHMVIILVDLATRIAVLAVAVLALPLIGPLAVLVVGMVIMVDIMAAVNLVAMATLVVVIMLGIGESLHLAILAAMVPMPGDLVGAIVGVA